MYENVTRSKYKCIKKTIHQGIKNQYLIRLIYPNINLSKYTCINISKYQCINKSTYQCINISKKQYINISMYEIWTYHI